MAETSEYLRPGAYIGQLIRPASSSVTGFPRLPVFVAKGSRLARAKNTEITRAKVFDEAMTFIGVGPYTYVLAAQADGVKTNTTLVADGVIVQDDRYLFSTTTVLNDTITIPSQYYDATAAYVITYQSVDRTVLDPMPFNDLRTIEKVSKGIGGASYLEFTDFVVPVTVGSPTADAGNDQVDGDAWGVSNGAGSDATLVGPSSENISFIMLTEEAGSAYTVSAVSGGAEGIVENTVARTVTVTYVTATSTQTTLLATLTPLIAGLTSVASVSGGAGSTVWSTPAQDQDVYSSNLDADVGNTGAGTVSLSPNSDYTHAYTRDYEIEVVTAGASATAVFAVASSPNSLGNTMQGHSPAHPDLYTTAALRTDVGPAANDADIVLDNGLIIRTNDLGGTFALGDRWIFRAFGPGKVEADLRHSNTNQFTTIGAVADVGTPAGTGVLTVSSGTDDYTGTYNRTFTLIATTVTGTPDVVFKWNAVGDDGVSTGTTAVLADSGTALLANGVTIQVDLSGGNFVVGDSYTFTILAPRVVPTIKDDRTFTGEVSSAAAGNVGFLYFTDTPEGGIGSFTATSADPHIELDGNLTMHVRNLATPRYAIGDDFVWSVTLDDVIDWSLRQSLTETITSDQIIHDVLGRVTGTPDTYYATLNNIPDSITSIRNTVPATVAGTIVTTAGDNTKFIDFGGTDPGDDLTVVYQYLGNEPKPGETYRFTALYLRDSDLYNIPVLVTSEADGKALTEPMGATNHLGIMNSIVWDYDPIGVYLCQVKDTDDDGVYQDSDYEAAIESTEGTSDITDLVVLDAWGTISKQLEHLDKLADPLVNKQRLGWFGAPVDTSVGDVNTPGSLVYTAKVTMAVYGDSPSHGTRVMVAPTSCNRTVTFDDGSAPIDVDLDGSFVAAAMCMTYASFRNPSSTALRTNLTVFNMVQTYTEAEDKILGGSQINYVEQTGDKVYLWLEDLTTDPIGTENSPEEFRIISAMIQKKYMNSKIQSAVDLAVIGLVPDAVDVGLGVLRNVIVNTVRTEVDNKNIGEYQNDDGTVRRMNPSRDVVPYRSRERNTVYRFYVAYFLKYPIKHVHGLALTDSNNFGALNVQG